jgi:hypothetical protein
MTFIDNAHTVQYIHLEACGRILSPARIIFSSENVIYINSNLNYTAIYLVHNTDLPSLRTTDNNRIHSYGKTMF